MPRGKSDKYAIKLSEADLDELEKLAQATKDQNAEVKKAGYTAMLNDVLQRTDTAIDMQQSVQSELRSVAKYLIGMLLVMSIVLLANFGLTISAVEMSKESHITSGAMTDTTGKIVQVASSDFHVGPGGKMVQRTSGQPGRRLADGDQTGSAIGTAPALAKYKLSSRIPNKYLEELESITMAGPCAKDATVVECDSKPTTKAVVKSFKRQPREGSHCGSVVVFQTDLGELTLDDDTLYRGGAAMVANGMFSLGDARSTNMNISSEGRRLMEAGAAPAVDANLHGSFKFLGNVNGDEFTCEMGGVIGGRITITPPKAPAIPYTHLVLKESTCSFDKRDSACESNLIAGPKPGVTQHANFTTMRSYEQVLLTHTHRVVVSYFASQPLSRLIQITHFASMVFTQYISFKQGRAKINCIVKPIEGAGKTIPGSRNREVHLAYLSTAVDEGRDSMRWALSPYNELGNIIDLHTEYWERVGTRKPRRIFLHGESVIAPGVSVDLMATPQEFVDFTEGMAEEEVAHWIKTTLGFVRMDDAVDCYDDGVNRGSMPPYLGPFGEAGARWVAAQLQEDDLERFGRNIVWSSSYYQYWNAVVATLGTPSVAGPTVNKQSSGNGRRLYSEDEEEDENYKDEAAKDPSYPKVGADMKEFMGCIKDAKDCMSGKRVRRLGDSSELGGVFAATQCQGENKDDCLKRLGAISDGKTPAGQTFEDIQKEREEAAAKKKDGPGSCAKMLAGALEAVAAAGLKTAEQKAICETMDAISEDTTATTVANVAGHIAGKNTDCEGYEAKLELSCGPCTIKIKLEKLDWPDFACIFKGGSGCYWKTDGKGAKLSIVGGPWEKWKVRIPSSWTCGIQVGSTIRFTATTTDDTMCAKPGGSQIEYVGTECGLNKIQWNSVQTLDPAPGKAADECRWSRVPGCFGAACLAMELVAADHEDQEWVGAVIDPSSGLTLLAVTKHDGMYVWDLENNWMARGGNNGWTSKPIAQEYTQCYTIYWRQQDIETYDPASMVQTGLYRGLAAGDKGYAVTVQNTVEYSWASGLQKIAYYKLGMWTSDPDLKGHARFRDSGYSIRYEFRYEWNVVCIVGRGDTHTSFTGTTDFYVATQSTPEMRHVGTADRVVSGMTINSISNYEVWPGKLASFKHWNFARDLADLQPLATAALDETAVAARFPVLELTAADQRGEDVVDPRSGMTFGKIPVETYEGRAVWDLDSTYMTRAGTSWVVKNQYTQCAHISWRRSTKVPEIPGVRPARNVGATNHVWRTLFKGSGGYMSNIYTKANDRRRGHSESGLLYMHSSGARRRGWIYTGFRFDMSVVWHVLCVVGRGAPIGTSDFYVATHSNPTLVHVATSGYVVTGGTLDSIGGPGEYPGKLASLVHWNYALEFEEMQQYASVHLVDTPHTPTVELVAARQLYDEVVCPRTGTYFGTHNVTHHDGEIVWNLDNDFLEWTCEPDLSGRCEPSDAKWALEWTGPKITKNRFRVGEDYTQCYHLKWKEGSSVERTLFVGKKKGGSEHHAAFVPKGGNSLGMELGNGFDDSGYDINVAEWNVLCIRGNGADGGRWQDFWVATPSDPTMKRVGSVDHVVSGNEVYRIGGGGPGGLSCYTMHTTSTRNDMIDIRKDTPIVSCTSRYNQCAWDTLDEAKEGCSKWALCGSILADTDGWFYAAHDTSPTWGLYYTELYVKGSCQGLADGPGKLAVFKHWNYVMPKVHMQVFANNIFSRTNVTEKKVAGAVGSRKWKKEWLGECGVGPTIIETVPSDCYSCPTVIKVVMNTEEAAFCAKSGGSQIEYTGTSCGGSKIIWNTMRTLDPADGKTPEACSWKRPPGTAPDQGPIEELHMLELRAKDQLCFTTDPCWAIVVDPRSGTIFSTKGQGDFTASRITHAGPDFQDKVFWDLLESNYIGVETGERWIVERQYTQCYHLLWRQEDRLHDSWRTRSLFTGYNSAMKGGSWGYDVAVMVHAGPGERLLGVWSEEEFHSSGYSMTDTNIAEWNVVCAVGRSTSDTQEYPASALGTTDFYLSTASAPTLRHVGTSDRVVSGVQLWSIGMNGGQGPGKLVEFSHWNYALPLEELQRFAMAVFEPEKLSATTALRLAQKDRRANAFGSCGVAPSAMPDLPTDCAYLPETTQWEGPVASSGEKVAIQSVDNHKFLIDNGGVVGIADEAGSSAKWTLEDAGNGKYFIISQAGRHLQDHWGLLQLTDPKAGRAQYEKWVQDDAPGAGYYIRSYMGTFLSAPAGSFGCTLCVYIIDRELGEKAGLSVKTCVGFGNGCWFYIEIIGERVPKPAWAQSSGILLTVTGYIKLCVVPLSIYGWIMLKLERGFCKEFFGIFTATFSIYGGLKFEILWEYNNSDGGTLTFTGSAFVGISGGIYKPGSIFDEWLDNLSSWGGRRRRRRRRRRHKCRCGRVDAKGTIESCPKIAGASGQITFTVKVWPCAKGQDATMTGTLGFQMSLEVFGISIPLPKIPDITLFKTNLRKPFG